MSDTYFACCGGWTMFLVAVMTITEILSPSLNRYIDAKAEAIRALIAQHRKEKKRDTN
jgi:hypothetical protein